MSNPLRRTAALASSLFCLSLCASLSAADRTWTGSAGDGNFANTSNWSGGVAPANNDWQDNGVFGSPASPSTVNVPSSRSIVGLKFNTAGWTLTGSTFTNLKNLTSAGSGTNTVSTNFNQYGAGSWNVGSGNTLVLSSSFYQRANNITLTGGGTLRVSSSIGGFSGTVGAWGLHIQDATVRVTVAAPYTSGSAGAMFLDHENAKLQLATTLSAAQALVGNRVRDGLGGGLVITDIGGGYVEITTLSDPMPPISGDWALTFEDTFDGSTVDGTKWKLGQHWGGMAGAGSNSAQNVTVSGGALRLKSGQGSTTYCGTTRNYSSAEISTFQKFRLQNGYYEARIKYPAVTGLWPAFWLMPDRADYGWKDAYTKTYLKFDLTGVNPGTINTAELKTKVSSMDTGGNRNVAFMKLYNDSWTESTITWNNAPAPDPIWIDQRWNQSTVGADMTVDVKDYVASQMSGDKKISFVLADTFMLTKGVYIHSSEAANQADRPRLVINGVTYYATEDAQVRWGTLANTNYGSGTTMGVKDSWGDTATTFNGGMEIDIQEALGIWGPNETSHALHWDGYGSSHQSTGFHPTLPADADGWRTYGLYWEPGMVQFYVDGVKTGEWINSRVMSVPAYIILSLQLGGWDNNNAGSQVNNQTMEVDYVRVWSGESL